MLALAIVAVTILSLAVPIAVFPPLPEMSEICHLALLQINTNATVTLTVVTTLMSWLLSAKIVWIVSLTSVS